MNEINNPESGSFADKTADKTYVRRRLGEAICEGYFARCKAAPAWRTFEIPCGHDLAPPSLSRHNTLSLASAAAYTAAGRTNCAEGGAGTTPFFCA